MDLICAHDFIHTGMMYTQTIPKNGMAMMLWRCPHRPDNPSSCPPRLSPRSHPEEPRLIIIKDWDQRKFMCMGFFLPPLGPSFKYQFLELSLIGFRRSKRGLYTKRVLGGVRDGVVLHLSAARPMIGLLSAELVRRLSLYVTPVTAKQPASGGFQLDFTW